MSLQRPLGMTKAPELVLLGGSSGVAPLAICNPVAWNGLASDPYRTWAFRRADQVAFTASPFLSPAGERLVMAHIKTLPTRMQGIERLERIAERLLTELATPLVALDRGTRIAFFPCLPERMGDEHGEREARGERARLVALLAALASVHGAIVEVTPVCRGHASLAFALVQATMALASHGVEVAIVGGLDTAYDPIVIEELIDARRIFDGENLNTACPGEGGAFFLLTAPSTARRLGWRNVALLEGVGTGNEPGHSMNDVGCIGTGLTAAARPLADRLARDRRRLDWWIHDVTNEHYRVHELQMAWPRSCSDVMGPEGVLDGLHAHLGDLGAAAMPTAVAIATEGFRRRGPVSATCVVTGSSLWADRGAVLLSRP